MALSRLRTSKRSTGTAIVVTATGILDATSADAFESAFRSAVGPESKVTALIGDIRGLTAVTSAGLRKILRLLKWSRAQGTKFVLCCATDNTTGRVLAMSGFDQLVDIYPAPAVALTQLRE